MSSQNHPASNESSRTRLEFQEFSAWIEVDGEELNCYAIHANKKEKTVTCWVPSEEGKEFSISTSKEITRYHCQTSAYLDGKWVGRYYSYKWEDDTDDFDYIKSSRNTARPFIFASMQTTDDDAYLDTALLSKSAQALGKISLKIHRVTNLRRRWESDEDDCQEKIPNLKVHKVHERSQKAVDLPHQIAYGEEFEFSEPPMTASCDVRELVAKFVFKYRSIEALRACGIAPLTVNGPQEVPHEGSDGVNLLPETSVVTGNSSASDKTVRKITVEVKSEGDRSDTHVERPEVERPSVECPRVATPQPEVHVRQEDPDDIYLPETPTPHEDPSGSSNVLSPFDLENKVEVKPKQEEDELDASEDDDEVKALVAELERVRNEKRKMREAASGPRKRVKREKEVSSFFKPGEVPEVIDLT